MAVLNKNDLLKRINVSTVKLSDGGEVCLRPLPASEFIKQDQGKGMESPEMLIKSLCDENGNLLFGEGDSDAVLSLPLQDFTTLIKEVMRINGLEKTEKN